VHAELPRPFDAVRGFVTERVPTSDSPMITLAIPSTTIPTPICTSANPWYCANATGS